MKAGVGAPIPPGPREIPWVRRKIPGRQAARVRHIHYPECEQILRELVRSGDHWTDGQTYRLPGY